MPTRLILVSTLLASGLLFSGCKVDTDLGIPCHLVKADPTDPTGKKGVPITEADFPDGEPQGDLISFGSTDCDNLVCVQDAANRNWTGDPTNVLMGYCSKPCIEGSATTCTPQQDTANDEDPGLKMSCRSLLLDSATMSRLCQTDPEKCAQYFGGTTSPYFCARGDGTGTVPTDGGTGNAGTPDSGTP